MDLFPFKHTEDFFLQNEEKPCVFDIIGLSECKSTLKTWYYSTTKDVLLIIGPTGCGKTSLVNFFCTEEDIILYTAVPKKDLLKDISLFLENSSLFCKNTKKKLVLIDEYSTPQINLLSMQEILNLSGKARVVVISSGQRGSNLSELKKNSKVYCIPDINLKEIHEWAKTLTTIPDSNLTSLINKCKNDKRLLLNAISFIKKSNKGDIDKFINSFYKNSDINAQDFLNELFDPFKKISLTEIYNIYETDGYFLSNLVHENYLSYSDDIHGIANSADCISYGETVFSDTFESNRTFLPHSHCTNSLFLPSYYGPGTNKDPMRAPVINNRFNIFLNNQKIIDKINLNSKTLLGITDILYIKKFLTQSLIKNKNININELDYLKNIMNIFIDSKIETLELIYKHFSNFKEITKEPKTKNFTLKFKEKLIKLI